MTEFFGSLQGLGIETGTLLMFAMLLVLLVSGIPLAFVTLLVALIFALGCDYFLHNWLDVGHKGRQCANRQPLTASRHARPQ